MLELKEACSDDEWIIGGDFNAVKHHSEKKGISLNDNNNGMNFFAEFVEKSELVDILCKGNNFSWYSGDEESMSRIDRFLLSEVIVKRWNVIGQ